MNKVILAANTDWYLYNFRLSLARYLQEAGYEAVLVSPAGKYSPEFPKYGLRWVEWVVGRQTMSPWEEVPSFIQLARIYRQEKADLIHHHTIKSVLYGSLTARGLREENVVNSITGRGYVFLGRGARVRLLRNFVKNFYRKALNHPNFAAIFENDADRQYFIDQRFIAPQRTWLIPGVGVDPQRFQPFPEPEGAPVIFLVGRLLWDKGVGVLVEAARILQARKRSFRVALVGEPDPGNPSSIETNILQAWVKEGIVEWWGWRPDMSTVYPQCHIVAAPTMYGEGVPTVVLEASACGRPVVTTDMPGCRDVVIHQASGLIVPPEDAEALAEALDRLIRDKELRLKMGAEGRRLVLDRFTTRHINAATLEVYHQVLNKHA
ncbi:MAG: glycosyltransferase family 4 protein [Anaerolineales bacterium]|nr:glycosyltransferase family 4 protein [Anaerolineales bacterium]